MERLTAAKRRKVVWDDRLKGFGVRVSATGRASWIVKRRLGSGGEGAKQVFHSFGTLGEMDAEQARKKAQDLLQEIRGGVDLEEHKRQQRLKEHEAYRNGRLEDVWQQWIDRKRDDRNKVRRKGRSYWDGIERLGAVEILPFFGAATLVCNITKHDCRKLIEQTEDRSKAVARMLFACLRPFFLWCVERELIIASPLGGLSQPEQPSSRDRTLTDAEIVLVWKAASAMPYPWGPFYKLLLLSAQRREEVSGMRWSELDLKKREWTIPKERTKNGVKHLVHSSSWALDILHGIAHDETGNTFVFTTNGDKSSVCGFSKARKALDKKIKELNGGRDIAPWRVHDLRRTAATGMASLGIAPHVIERVLNHVTGKDVGGIVSVYQRFEYLEERRKALSAWSDYIDNLLIKDASENYPPQSNVVAFQLARST